MKIRNLLLAAALSAATPAFAQALAQQAPAAAPADPAAQAARVKALSDLLAQMQRQQAAAQPAAPAAPALPSAPGFALSPAAPLSAPAAPAYAAPPGAPAYAAPGGAPVVGPGVGPGVGTAGLNLSAGSVGNTAKKEVLKPGLLDEALNLPFYAPGPEELTYGVDQAGPDKSTTLQSLSFLAGNGGGFHAAHALSGVLIAPENGDYIAGFTFEMPGWHQWPVPLTACKEAETNTGFGAQRRDGVMLYVELEVGGQTVIPGKVVRVSPCEPIRWSLTTQRGQMPLQADRYDVKAKVAAVLSCGPGASMDHDVFYNSFSGPYDCAAKKASLESFLAQNAKWTLLLKRPSDTGLGPNEAGPMGPKTAAFRHAE